MRRKANRSGKRPLVAALLVLLLVVVLVTALLPLRQTLLVRCCEAELARTPDDGVGEVLRKMADFGEPGLGAVVRALGSARTCVCESAYQTLTDELNAWSRLEPLDADDRLSTLAAALAERADERSPAARGAAARLAIRVLLWPCDSAAAERDRLVADCERVLQAAGAPSKRPAKSVPAARRRAHRHPAPSVRVAAAPHRGDAEALANLPATTMPLPDFEFPTLARAATAGLSTGAGAAEPGRFDASQATAIAGRTPDGSAGDEADSIDEDDSATAEASLVSSKQRLQGGARRLSAVDTMTLFEQLHDSDGAATEAAAELRARGLTIRQIEVGMHLTAPDAHERRVWTEALPGIRGVSAKAWLLHLSRDESLAVRRAAVSLLATSGDPEMLRRVAEVGRQESDPDLRLEAARAAELLEAPAP